MGYKINVFVGDELVDAIELDIQADKVVRIGVDKDSGEIASIGSPPENSAINVIVYVRTNDAMTGEEAQAIATTRNEEAAKEALANQLPPDNPQPPDTILPTSDGAVVQEPPVEVTQEQPTPDTINILTPEEQQKQDEADAAAQAAQQTGEQQPPTP